MDFNNDKRVLIKHSEFELESSRPTTTSHIEHVVTFPLQLSQETMQETLQMHPKVLFFFKSMGVLWPNKNTTIFEKTFQLFWSSVIHIFLVLMCFFALTIPSYFLIEDGSENILLNVSIGVTLLIQCLVLFPALNLISKRLNRPIPLHDIPFYNDSVRISYIMCAITVLIGLVTPILDVFVYIEYGVVSEIALVIVAVGQLSISCILSTTFLFIIVDCKVSSSIIDSLMLEYRQKSLTIDTINHARTEIRTRVQASKNTNNSIIFVAILDIACAIIVLLFVLRKESLYSAFLFLFMLFKEIPFLLIVLYLSAEVNEKSDAFVTELGLNVWDIEQDHSRVMLYVNAQAKKLSFPLAGMRLRKIDLMWKFATWLIALLIGVLKAIILSVV